TMQPLGILRLKLSSASVLPYFKLTLTMRATVRACDFDIVYSVSCDDRLSGQATFGSSLTHASLGTPVFTYSRYLRNKSGDICAFTLNISFCLSDAVSTVLGVNCAVLATKETLAGTGVSGAASSTKRTSVPIATF